MWRLWDRPLVFLCIAMLAVVAACGGGDALIVSRSTAKFHASSILGKLAAQSRTEAVARAVAEGLLAGRVEQEAAGHAGSPRPDSHQLPPA